MKKIVFLLIAFVYIQARLLQAQKPAVVTNTQPGWYKIGETHASFKMENEAIAVIGADVFKSIKLKVTNASITIQKVKVHYEAGETEEIEVKSELRSGAETRTLDVQNKDIKKVSFTYKSLPNSKDEKAQVELWGLK